MTRLGSEAIFVKFGKGHKRLDETGSNRLKLGTARQMGVDTTRLYNLPHFTILNSEVARTAVAELTHRS